MTDFFTNGRKTDADGNAYTTMGTTLAGEDQSLDRQWGGPMAPYTQITTATTTTVKSGAGVFYGIRVVTGAAGTTVTVYDNTAASGTKLIDAAATAVSGATLLPGPEGVALETVTGLTVVTSGTAVINVLWV